MAPIHITAEVEAEWGPRKRFLCIPSENTGPFACKNEDNWTHAIESCGAKPLAIYGNPDGFTLWQVQCSCGRLQLDYDDTPLLKAFFYTTILKSSPFPTSLALLTFLSLLAYLHHCTRSSKSPHSHLHTHDHAGPEWDGQGPKCHPQVGDPRTPGRGHEHSLLTPSPRCRHITRYNFLGNGRGFWTPVSLCPQTCV